MNQDNQTKADSQESVYYCYVLLDPRKPGNFRYRTSSGYATFDFEPFYVGKGKGNRNQQHFKKSSLSRESNFKNNKIKSIQRAGLEVINVRTRRTYDESSAFQNEYELIKAIGRHDLALGPLTNLTDGKEGQSGAIVSEATRKKMSEAKKGKFTYTPSAETRKKQSAAHKGKVLSEATKRKMSEVRKGRKLSDDHKAKLSAASKGRKLPPLSQAHKEAISQFNLGKKETAETKAKKSSAQLAVPQLSCPSCGRMLRPNNLAHPYHTGGDCAKRMTTRQKYPKRSA